MKYFCTDPKQRHHAWSGEGGLLDVQRNIAKRSGNSYTAWREATPQHNKLVDRVLQCPMHVAITLRTKAEYVIEDNGNGKKSPKKVDMAPVFRDSIEYEVTVFFELSQDHVVSATKDRTGVFDGQFFTISPDTGTKIRKLSLTDDAANQPHKDTKMTELMYRLTWTKTYMKKYGILSGKSGKGVWMLSEAYSTFNPIDPDDIVKKVREGYMGVEGPGLVGARPAKDDHVPRVC